MNYKKIEELAVIYKKTANIRTQPAVRTKNNCQLRMSSIQA